MPLGCGSSAGCHFPPKGLRIAIKYADSVYSSRATASLISQFLNITPSPPLLLNRLSWQQAVFGLIQATDGELLRGNGLWWGEKLV